jgi:glycosyltransferase involved in cell wall biosynthesis
MITAHFYPVLAGEERQTQWEAKALIDAGQPVTVITRLQSDRLPKNLPGSEVIDNTPVVRIASPGGKIASLFFLLGGFIHLLRHGRGGIYHSRSEGAPGWLAVIAGYLLGGRSIIKLRSGRPAFEGRVSGSPINRWQFVTMLRLAHRVTVVNGEVQQFIRSLGIRPERVLLIPNFVDTKLFQPHTPEEKTAKRKELGLSLEKTIVVFVGRVVWVKGLDVLLQAWAALSENVRKETLLVIVGDGAERQNLEKLSESLGIQDSILMVGMKEGVRDYYQAADMFVLPSRSEGMSTSLTEAMACGLPVIASSVGAAPDVVRDGENGILFQSENHQELAQKLAALFEQRDRWDEMGKRARETVTAYGDVSVTLKQVLQLYEELS